MSTITQVTFAKNVGRLRKLHGLSQAQVSEFVGVCPGMISRYENAKNFSMPPAEVIDKLAELYKVHIADLFTSDTAKLKRVDLQGMREIDMLVMLNKTLSKSGMMMVPLRKEEKVG